MSNAGDLSSPTPPTMSGRQKILYVMDDPGWIQASRLRELGRRIPEIELVPVLPRRLARGWRLLGYRRRPLYLASWRLIAAIARSHGLRLGPGELARTMVSVTSHYDVGGGLDPEKAVPRGSEPHEVYEDAVRTLAACAVVTVNSSPLHDLLAPRLPGLVYAPNGVDAAFYRPPERRRYDPARPRVGWAGKVKAAKNVETLRAVAAELAPEGFRFELVGGAKDEPAPLDAEGMRAFYHRIDWYLCASWHEGTPNPALEAAACGVPLVTTRVGNMVDVVREGENGFFVDPTPASIAARLRELRGVSPAEHARLGDTARATIEGAWTWDENVAPYREAFARLVDRAAASLAA